MEVAFPIIAFVVAAVATRKSLGGGLAAAIGVGYFNGVVRANFPGVFSTFTFDAAMLGFYLGALARVRAPRPAQGAAAGAGTAAVPGPPPALLSWVVVLCALPAVLAVIPVNDVLVQLVALRGTVWLLPAILVAARLGPDDLTTVARALAPLNVAAVAVGGYLYFFGVEALYPRNAVTDLMYRSQLGVGAYLRIPSTFLSAHAYGGTMAASLPFLLGALARPGGPRWGRGLLLAGVAAGCAGVVMCGARQPAVTVAATFAVGWAASGFSARKGAVLAAVLALAAGLVVTNERFRRVLQVQDTSMVAGRAYGSMNASFLDLLAEYPMGAGMGAAVGTSVPSFLADRAPKQVGMENEYSRILVDQGVVGLAVWLGFVGWVVWPPPRGPAGGGWDFGRRMMYAFVLVSWATAFIGTGLLASVPQSLMLVAQMGAVVAGRWRPSPARPPPPPPGRFHERVAARRPGPAGVSR